MKDWIPIIVAALSSAPLGAVGLELIRRARDARSGAGRKRRDEVDRAWQRADREATKRRIAEEYASRQTRRLIEAPCVETASIEPFPSYPPKES